MSTPISSITCFVHEDRPAVARCPSCMRYFCSECITEHEGKLTCALCLAAESETVVAPPAAPSGTSRKWLGWIRPFPILQLATALLLLWTLYFLLARLILSIPDDFHEGTIWES